MELHPGNGGDDDDPTMDVDGVKVHSTGYEYDNEGAGNVGETSGSESANTNGHLGYVVGRISPAGVATTLQINDRSGSRDVIGLATQGGRVDNDGAGNVVGSGINGLPEDVVGRNPRVGPVTTDETNGPARSADVVELTVQGDAVVVYSSVDGVCNGETGNVWYAVSPSTDRSGIVGHPEDVVGRSPRVGPVSADEINGQAVVGLVVQGDAVSPSTVAVANVKPVVSTMGFAGLGESNGDAGQHGQPRCPGVSNDMVPVLGVHGAPVQGDADRCRQATTPGILADDDEGSGPKRCPFGPGDQLVNKGRSLGKTNASRALVPKSGSTIHGQHGQSSTSGAVANDVDGSG